MSPPVATDTFVTPDTVEPHFQLKSNGANGKATYSEADVLEDYEGNYRFAPIEEAQVSRAMIKRCGQYSSLYL